MTKIFKTKLPKSLQGWMNKYSCQLWGEGPLALPMAVRAPASPNFYFFSADHGLAYTELGSMKDTYAVIFEQGTEIRQLDVMEALWRQKIRPEQLWNRVRTEGFLLGGKILSLHGVAPSLDQNSGEMSLSEGYKPFFEQKCLLKKFLNSSGGGWGSTNARKIKKY